MTDAYKKPYANGKLKKSKTPTQKATKLCDYTAIADWGRSFGVTSAIRLVATRFTDQRVTQVQIIYFWSIW